MRFSIEKGGSMQARYPKEGPLCERSPYAIIDHSNACDGYMIVRVFDEDPLKKFQIQVTQDVKHQNFVAHPVHKEVYIPMVYGSGDYKIFVCRNIVGSTYSYVLSLSKKVELKDEFSPWLGPTAYAKYNKDSNCVKLAEQVCKNCLTDFDRMKAILTKVMDSLVYDTYLAQTVSNKVAFWVPNPDEVLKAGKSICYGYSSLAAAMWRSQGIPAKIVVGYAGRVYHAWNLVYLENGGSLLPGFYIKPREWTLIDSTFADTGGSIRAFYDFAAENDYKVDYYG